MGKFIVIDGLDASGKATLAGELEKYLKDSGRKVMHISFPRYNTKGATAVEMYLHGELGEKADDTNGYAASTFFAVDRYISYVTEWKSFLEQPDTVLIADRYTSANAVHQLTKLECDKWDEFLDWLYDFEFSKLKLPTPDITLYLEMLPEISRRLIMKRRDETGRSGDIHEDDKTHLDRAYKAALYASKKLGWKLIRCYEGNEPRSLDDIFNEALEVCGL